MSGVLERAAGFFLAPAAQPRAETTAVTPAARTVVLGSAADAVPLAAAIAMSPSPGGLVAMWSSDDGVGVGFRPSDDGVGVGFRPSDVAIGVSVRPSDGAVGLGRRRGIATRAAAQLAARLSSPDLPAAARGRLAWLVLPPDPAGATAAVRRASALVDGSLVTALCGARPPELDGLVAEHDLAVVAAAPDAALARAAVAQLAAAGVTACACAPLPRGVMRMLTLAGVGGPRLADLREAR
jgi:hypothetical protein